MSSGVITETNNTTVDPLTNGEYANVTADINTALHTLGYLRINIFTDLSGTMFAQDNLGNDINNRTIYSTRYIYPTTDLSGNTIDGDMIITFTDGTTYENNDINNTAYAYYLTGLEAGGIKYLT
jgi:hypothetical protein